MIDFHTHTFFSDGVLSPAEHVRRALVAGYKTLGITDHVDASNLEFVYTSMLNFIRSIENSGWDIKIIPGIEITHVPASKIEGTVSKARDMKIPLVIVHGETAVEPVEKGTNRAAIEAGVDILAHPGLILEEDVKRASELGINLEITARKGHSITNGLVAKLAKKYDARLVLDSDTHAPGDLLSESFRTSVMYGCGMESAQVAGLEKNMADLSEKLIKRICK
jgi:putative hydrolase